MKLKKKKTKSKKSGTLSTRSADKKMDRPEKHKNLLELAKKLLGKKKIRFLPHANLRMSQRNIIDYEVRQALHNGKHKPQKDRFSKEWNSWEYNIEGKTLDARELRIGVSIENSDNGELLLVVTVIDPNK